MMLTASLGVSYRRPVLDSSTYLIEVRSERLEERPAGKSGQQLRLTATVSDWRGRVCADGSALYVIKEVHSAFAARGG